MIIQLANFPTAKKRARHWAGQGDPNDLRRQKSEFSLVEIAVIYETRQHRKDGGTEKAPGDPVWGLV